MAKTGEVTRWCSDEGEDEDEDEDEDALDASQGFKNAWEAGVISKGTDDDGAGIMTRM